MKRKLSSSTDESTESFARKSNICAFHTSHFSNHDSEDDEKLIAISGIRKKLLSWYDSSKRTLPWRTLASESSSDNNQRGYGIWISEVMLQQTQVATVIDYYNRWMGSWPTVTDLASANLDSINRLWSGLGYYSRAKRLLEGAVKVVNEFDGLFPSTVEGLRKIPGVGQYTACAVASIAYNCPVGVVDGNVVRVLTRLKAIGKDSSSKEVMDLLWRVANELVDPERPGDFNQSLMELGATICTPKNPSCKVCPLKDECAALKEISSLHQYDIEDCHLCIRDYDKAKGVMNYPVKLKKTKVRDAVSEVIIIRTPTTSRYLLFQRPSIGLLANLYEFFSILSKDETRNSSVNELYRVLRDDAGIECSSLQYIGEVFHQFSHISQTYKVWSCTSLAEEEDDLSPKLKAGNYQSFLLMDTAEDVQSSSISTAMKKVLRLYQKQSMEPPKKQKRITSFFTTK
uniref:Adenine DNA glycosylase n=1 Tax=Lepeophtheirus salmonis TaxID=72036 RepID=A0A0K2TUJ6_LEPSM